MSFKYPYAAFPTFSGGMPTRFIVGPANATRCFDIHQLLLGTYSRIFNVSEGKPRIINREIRLLNTDPDVFQVLCHWLYSDASDFILEPTKAEELAYLMEMWVAYAELGLDFKMNAIMRAGMALMQPKDFVCPISTVEWVYAHTNPKSKLRGYIIAIFCQRGPRPTPELFRDTNSAIFADAIKFFKVLNKIRKENPQKSANGTILNPLPDFLVWGDKWQTLPDDQFFVRESDEWQEGGAVLMQLKMMNPE